MMMESKYSPHSLIAYFSMEIGLDSWIPTYSGGLGVLAGDTLRSAADLAVPMVGITLVHRAGHFRQILDKDGNQREDPARWRPEEKLEELPNRVKVQIEGRDVTVRAWRFQVVGITGYALPVYLLDTDLPENSHWDRSITDSLYGGDEYYRLCQEIVLGMGGVAMLDSLGYSEGLHYHMNEGHSALLTLALLEKRVAGRGLSDVKSEDIDAVRWQCMFTTHTPVPAGHDKFPTDMVVRTLGHERASALRNIDCCGPDVLNMTYLGLFFSRYINGVAMRHGEVSRGMFPHYPINAITNGVHSATWVSDHMARVFDERIWGWRTDNNYLRYALDIPVDVILEAHTLAKQDLIEEVRRSVGRKLDPSVLTLGIARRATPYKRLDLIFSRPDNLERIARTVGPIQIIYAGKAHPKDEPGKEMIRKIFHAAKTLDKSVKVVYLENYEMELAKKLCAGVDLWVNTPLRPREASGTSGMKAAVNGVPSFSVHDGWWVEGHIEGVTGWTIGSEDAGAPNDSVQDVEDMYFKLARVIMPLFYGSPRAYARVMRSSIAFNGSFFNTQRMVAQYLTNAYFPAVKIEPPKSATAPR
jgi:starch phosphorylase